MLTVLRVLKDIGVPSEETDIPGVDAVVHIGFILL
jgi:hypothetical protein